MHAARLWLLRQARPLVAAECLIPFFSNQSRAPSLLVSAAQHFHTGGSSAAAHDDGFGEWDKKQKVGDINRKNKVNHVAEHLHLLRKQKRKALFLYSA